MPTNRDVQRRHRQRDDGRRGHPLQHRDRTPRDRNDEGWADRGTWANLDDSGNERRSLDDGRGDRGHSTVDNSPVRQLSSGERHHQSTQRSDAASGFGSDPKGNDDRRDTPGRAPGGGRRTSNYESQGNPRTGSQRGDDSNQGIAGRPGKQFGDLHGPRPSGARSAGYHDDDHYGGQRGAPVPDRQFGSRHGHGSRRREDPRVRDRE